MNDGVIQVSVRFALSTKGLGAAKHPVEHDTKTENIDPLSIPKRKRQTHCSGVGPTEKNSPERTVFHESFLEPCSPEFQHSP